MVRFKVRVRVSVSVSYIMTIWRWEEFSRCDKFPTTPALATGHRIESHAGVMLAWFWLFC